MQIALIGCGAIGTALLELVKDDAGLQVAAIVVPGEGADAARAVAQRLAPQASVGALSADGLLEQLEAAARTGGTQAQLIAGAIGAIDALAAARIGGLSVVRYTGRKPPRAWKGTPAEQGRNLDALTAETVIFEGSAREATRLYPKNANVAGTVSLAGMGLDNTTVRLIADPAVTENVHQVEAQGAFGSFELTMRNQPLAANPKTSALTVYSAVRALRGHVTPLVI